MLRMVDQDDGTSLLQLPKMVEKSQLTTIPTAARGDLKGRDPMQDFVEDSVSFMQTGVDKFGILLQKLLGLDGENGTTTGQSESSLPPVRPGRHSKTWAPHLSGGCAKNGSTTGAPVVVRRGREPGHLGRGQGLVSAAMGCPPPYTP